MELPISVDRKEVRTKVILYIPSTTYKHHGLINGVVYKKPLVHEGLEGCNLCLHSMLSSK